MDMTAGESQISIDFLFDLRQAFRVPRGRYSYDRASQLSGVPTRTLHHWARTGFMVPDFSDLMPKMWSYRDLVFLRLAAWLRTMRMPPAKVAALVNDVQFRLEDPHDETRIVKSDGRVAMLGELLEDWFTGQTIIKDVAPRLLDEFDLLAPIDVGDLGRKRLWGPNLLFPTSRTSIAPWVMGGEPVLKNSRIATGSLYALHQERGLDVEAIARLYPGTEPESVRDAIRLEDHLRRHLPLAA